MNQWSVRAAASNMKLGLLPLAAFGFGCAMAAGAGGNDEVEAVAIWAGLVMCALAAVLIGWFRPRGFGGAALGAALVLLAIMLVFRTTKWPFTESAAFVGLVALAELLGIGMHVVVGRFRSWARS